MSEDLNNQKKDTEAGDDNASVKETNDDLKDKIIELERRSEENLAGWKRARADYQNLKREWEKKQTQFMVDAKRILFAEFLLIYDHLKQALEMPLSENQGAEWRRGIAQIKSQCDALLKRWNVESVPTVGEKFDPKIHDAVDHQPAGNEIISQEVSGGYKVDGELLYPARVIVGAISDLSPPNKANSGVSESS